MSALDEARTAYESARAALERHEIEREERLARLAETFVALPVEICERLEQAAQAHGVERNALAVALWLIAIDEHPELFSPESIN